MIFPDSKLKYWKNSETFCADDGTVHEVVWKTPKVSVNDKYPTLASWNKYLERELSKTKSQRSHTMKTVIKTRKAVAPSVEKFIAEKIQVIHVPSKAPSIKAKVSEYNGHKVLAIKKTADDTFPLTFGLVKAQLIVEHIDEIRSFVAQYAHTAKQKVA